MGSPWAKAWEMASNVQCDTTARARGCERTAACTIDDSIVRGHALGLYCLVLQIDEWACLCFGLRRACDGAAYLWRRGSDVHVGVPWAHFEAPPRLLVRHPQGVQFRVAFQQAGHGGLQCLRHGHWRRGLEAQVDVAARCR